MTTERAAGPSPAGRLAGLAAAALALASVFFALGLWQLERRVWKLDLIARVEARLQAAPVAAPGPAAWPALSRESDEYRRVRISGAFDNARETLVQAVSDYGSGFWALTPFQTDDGFTALVNRGFVPPDKRDPSSRAGGLVEGPTTIAGLLRLTEPKGGFLRDNDPAADLWRSRDVAAIAARRGLSGPTAPYFIDADARPVPGGWPVGGLTVVAFRNNHLVYALTWFALALGTLIGAGLVARSELSRHRR